MDIFEAIAQRHSYRGEFIDTPVSRDNLRKIVQAGIHAPSGCNAQSTTFIIVDDGTLLEKINTLLSVHALAFIVCITDPKPVYMDMSFEKQDCAAAVENMLLAITALGYASVWIEGKLRREGRSEKLAQILNVPHDKCVQVVLPVGIPVEPGVQREKKVFEERVWFNSYGK
ncbi:MAG: nitroreductase family protein [bacterium]